MIPRGSKVPFFGQIDPEVKRPRIKDRKIASRTAPGSKARLRSEVYINRHEGWHNQPDEYFVIETNLSQA